ncbi:MAG TPA: phosphoenolpyruvate--protein phosphotransferase [Treponemataceae bacterium]|nr:phosphoenolpyruvate--protein phosphotransferase [Treponemataceae bacterium]
MRKHEGLSASGGIALGPVFRLIDEAPVVIPHYNIGVSDLDSQWNRFEIALEKSRSEIEFLKDDRGGEQTGILDAHLMMLCDPEFIPQIRADLEKNLLNIETILKNKIDETAGMLRAIDDSYLSERAVDIEDAFDRVMGHLLEAESGVKVSRSKFVPPGTILVAKNLRPSETITLRDSGIVGIILEEGGATSHVAILARAWRIPAVMGVRGILGELKDGESLILDGTDGLVIEDPTKDILNTYQLRLVSESSATELASEDHDRLVHSAAVTLDGIRMTLRANIALAEEAELAKEEGSEGVGLYRSEFLYLTSSVFPSEESQFLSYREAIQAMNGEPVVIRTLDAGADKMIGEQIALAEKNPLLGWRAVRYCLDRRDMFKEQLRALLRASMYGDLRIMFPMISNVEELDAVLDVLEEAKSECDRDELEYNPHVKIGIMIEIPAAAVCADLLAQKIDFMSIGTNDLIQYTMAVDRENPKVAHLFDCFNPAVLRLIKYTIEAGERSRTEVSMCGEMAGDPAAVLLLMGMGLRSFSMAVPRISPVKQLVRKVALSDAKELADAAMELSAAREIRKLVQEKLKTYE